MSILARLFVIVSCAHNDEIKLNLGTVFARARKRFEMKKSRRRQIWKSQKLPVERSKQSIKIICWKFHFHRAPVKLDSSRSRRLRHNVEMLHVFNEHQFECELQSTGNVEISKSIHWVAEASAREHTGREVKRQQSNLIVIAEITSTRASANHHHHCSVDLLTLISIPSLHLAAFYNVNGAATSWHDRQQRCEARDSADFRWKTTRQNESRMIYDARAWHVLRIIYSSNFSSLFLLFHFFVWLDCVLIT